MLEYLVKGGPVMILIGLASVIALALVIIQWLRFLEISDKNSKPTIEIIHAIKKRDWMRAFELTRQFDHPFLKSWHVGFKLLTEGKHDLKDIEEAVSIEGAKTIAKLESALKPLGALTATLPMLGFLGTILGLIVSFRYWEQMGAQVSISGLAAGIYQAMITTAAGLIAAIPYHFLYHHFIARAERTAFILSQETTELLREMKRVLLDETFESNFSSIQEGHPATANS
ncbi:MAG: MotA/TolQ/ExbB proton channel family protein [Candidatus Omnitrophica bacterium]|nr:MotA/TolQ/ExbB proton channel family protein [Candidatus Omnitrophota bacterium]